MQCENMKAKLKKPENSPTKQQQDIYKKNLRGTFSEVLFLLLFGVRPL